MSAASGAAATTGAPASATAPASSFAPVLSVEHLSMRFGGLVAINDLCFTARRGDITALIGPNGAGKTTVFNCITGFYKPSEGRIALQFGDPGVWEELGALTERGTRSVSRGDGVLFLLERMPDYLVTQRARVARTFQNIRLFQGMTVLENLLVAQHNPLMWASGYTVLGALGLPSYARAERSAIDKARYWLERTALSERAERGKSGRPHQCIVLGDQKILEHGLALKQPDVLERPCDAGLLRHQVVGHALEQEQHAVPACNAARAALGQSLELLPHTGVAKLQRDTPLARLVEASDAVEHGGLAGTVWPDQRSDIAATGREREVVDGDQPAEAHAEVLYPQDGDQARGQRGRVWCAGGGRRVGGAHGWCPRASGGSAGSVRDASGTEPRG